MSKSGQPKVKTLTLSAWQDAYGSKPAASFYVVNNCKQPTELHFNATTADGQRQVFTIPNTYAPIDLTMLVPLDNLVKNVELRRLLQLGHLVICDSESAEDLITSNRQVQNEVKRAMGINAISDSETSSEGELTLRTTLTKESANNPVVNIEEVDDAEDDYVGAILEAAETEGVSNDKITQIFNMHQNKLTAEDLDQLLAASKNDHLTDLVTQLID